METKSIQDSPSTLKSSELSDNAPKANASGGFTEPVAPAVPAPYQPAFTTSVYDANRGWTDRRPLHRRAQSVRVQCGELDVYIYQMLGKNAANYGKFGVRVLREVEGKREVVSHILFTKDGTPLSTEEAEYTVEEEEGIEG